MGTALPARHSALTTTRHYIPYGRDDCSVRLRGLERTPVKQRVRVRRFATGLPCRARYAVSTLRAGIPRTFARIRSLRASLAGRLAAIVSEQSDLDDDIVARDAHDVTVHRFVFTIAPARTPSGQTETGGRAWGGEMSIPSCFLIVTHVLTAPTLRVLRSLRSLRPGPGRSKAGRESRRPRSWLACNYRRLAGCAPA